MGRGLAGLGLALCLAPLEIDQIKKRESLLHIKLGDCLGS